MGRTASRLDTTLAAARDWLTDEDQALVAALVLLAEQLDKAFSNSTMSQFLGALEELRSRKAERLGELSPIDRLTRITRT